jgi:predicted DNA-binding transcriptional regulator
MTAPVLSSPALLAFIKASPKVTNNDIAKRFGITAQMAATRTGLLFKQGRVTREIVGKTPANAGIFGYTFKADETQREREKTREVIKEELHVVVRPKAPSQPHAFNDWAGQTDTMSKSPNINDSLQSLADAMAHAILAQVKAKLSIELGAICEGGNSGN